MVGRNDKINIVFVLTNETSLLEDWRINRSEQ